MFVDDSVTGVNVGGSVFIYRVDNNYGILVGIQYKSRLSS